MTQENQLKALLVRNSLWNLHKEFLNVLKINNDKKNGYVSAPTEWFNLLMNSPEFLWVKEINSLMADVDILSEIQTIQLDHLQSLRFEIESLFLTPHTKTSSFHQKYLSFLMQESSLLPLHAQLIASVKTLPAPENQTSQETTNRQKWHTEHQIQSRLRRN